MKRLPALAPASSAGAPELSGDEAGSGDLLAVILAAGQGTRMKSHLPKVLHQVAGQAMVDHVLAAARAAGAGRVAVVVGHQADRLRRHFEGSSAALLEQSPQLGSGHALQQALPLLASAAEVLVLNGDAPLIEPGMLAALVSQHRAAGAEVSFLVAEVAEPGRLGRVIRQPDGRAAIREWADASERERGISEVNAGVYCFDAGWLARELPRLTLSAKGEYYLTELVERARRPNIVAAASGMVACVGVDTRQALAEAERVMQDRLRHRWMDQGVTFIDPGSVLLDVETQLGRDTIIYPNSLLRGSVIGEECIIGPGTRIEHSRVGNHCGVRESVLESAVLEDGVDIGPFSHLRPGSYVEAGAKLGNYVEIKNSRIGRETQIHHFSYTGDAQVGRCVNIGAGTITCNFNSESGLKSRTVIEDGASLGSDTMLVAPVNVGPGAMTGAGSVVTRDVPANSLAVGAPARVVRKAAKRAS